MNVGGRGLPGRHLTSCHYKKMAGEMMSAEQAVTCLENTFAMPALELGALFVTCSGSDGTGCS